MIRIVNGRGYEDGVTAVCDRTGQQIGAESVAGLRDSVAKVEREYLQAVDRAQADLARFRAFGIKVVAAADERAALDREAEVEKACVEAEAAAARYARLKAAT